MTLKEFQAGIHDPKLERIAAKVARVDESFQLDSRVIRAVIYARVSSEAQDVANSIDA